MTWHIWWFIYTTFVESLRIYIIYIIYMCVLMVCWMSNSEQKSRVHSLATSKRRIVCFFKSSKIPSHWILSNILLFSMFVSLFSLKRQTRQQNVRSQNCSKERLGVDITIKFIIIVWMNPIEIQSLGIGMVVEGNRFTAILRLPKKTRGWRCIVYTLLEN